MTTRAVVTDIEGTASSVAFAREVLFPYAANMLPYYIGMHSHDTAVSAILDEVRGAANRPDASNERLVGILQQWLAEDRLAAPLKALQDRIWEHGYACGDFTGHVYADAVRKLSEWNQSGRQLFVYSSRSVRAQQLLFGYSDAGDLRELFSGFFDTRIGLKREAGSYRAIAGAIGVPANKILFLSDVVEELDAAAAAGMRTTQLQREPGMVSGAHAIAASFDEIAI